MTEQTEQCVVVLDDLEALAREALGQDDPDGFTISVKSASGRADVRAYTRMLLMLHPALVLELVRLVKEGRQ